MASTTAIGAIALTLLILVLAGVAETLTLARARSKIRIRVHVNGTRGKSSVVRLIAAALRESGINTIAKTTGTLPRVIYTDGEELPVYRRSKANIIEQVKTIRHAANQGVDALVLECMALQPMLQSLTELRITRSTHTVITNARPDHLDVMGPTDRDVALALCGMIAVKGKVFTAEQKNIDVMKMAADDRGSSLLQITPDDFSKVSAEELARFRYVEHAENVALALAVCDDLDLDRETCLRGMCKAPPDPGAMTIHNVEFFGREMVFYNAFAANDPVSTERLWNMAVEENGTGRTKIAIVNCRADRMDRTVQMAEALSSWTAPDWVVLIGTGTQLFGRVGGRKMDSTRFVFGEGVGVEELFEMLVEVAGSRAMLMGMGNIGGIGLDVVRHFQNRQTLSSESAA